MRILDATAGNRAMWFNKNHKDVIYMDIRPEVRPDIVGDLKGTNFPDKTFDLIVCDPPHDSRNKTNKGIFGRTYGTFNAKEIRDMIRDGFKEFSRILKDDGFVILKWNDRQFPLKEILTLIEDFEPLFGNKTAFRKKHSSATYWICLSKRLAHINESTLFLKSPGK